MSQRARRRQVAACAQGAHRASPDRVAARVGKRIPTPGISSRELVERTDLGRGYVAGSTVASFGGMERQELLSLAFEMLADAVGDLLREGEDPRGYVFTAAHADSPLGEMLLHRHATAAEDAVCVMLPIDTLSRTLESYAFDAATGQRLAEWLANAPAPEHYRVVAIGRDGIGAMTLDADPRGEDDAEEAPVSLVRH